MARTKEESPSETTLTLEEMIKIGNDVHFWNRQNRRYFGKIKDFSVSVGHTAGFMNSLIRIQVFYRPEEDVAILIGDSGDTKNKELNEFYDWLGERYKEIQQKQGVKKARGYLEK